MPRIGGFDGRLDIGVPRELLAAIKAEAARQGVSVAALVRQILSQALAERAAAEGVQAVEKAVRQAIKPAEDRLAKLVVKAARAAATSMYLNVQVLADLGQHDIVDLYNQAQKKAIGYIREKDDDED